MMKFILNLILVLILTSCSSSTESSSVESSKDIQGSQNNDFSEYMLYDYIVPKDTREVMSYKYKNGIFVEEDLLEYQKEDAVVTQRSLTHIGGEVKYENPKNSQDIRDLVDVIIYQDEQQLSFKMKNFINILDEVTLKDGTCKVTKYYSSYTIDNRSFNDVLEISCPTSIGYYQKGMGLVVENSIEDLENNSYDISYNYGERKIGLVDKQESSFTLYNLDSAKEANVDRLWSAPYNLNGENMKIGIVDGGSVLDTHVELEGRVHNLSTSDTNIHATHVAGTLISEGIHLPDSRGFAKNAQLYSLDYKYTYFSKSVKELLNYGVLISNHSYGFEGAEGLGEYDGESKDFDALIYENPYIISVLAAGNDGRKYLDDSDYTKWGLIKGGANAKNVITVAAVEDASSNIADFSSRGPIKGGRLKPDISIDGFNVLSTSNYDNTAYSRMYGTSMAAPGVTGAVTLLSQRYKEINSANPRVDTIKAILFNTAKDIENPGPDFKSGFGQLDALEAVKVIDSMESDSSLIVLDSIRQNEHQKYFISSSKYQDFRVTLAWVDDTYQSCNSCANDVLINDIDIYLEDSSNGEIIYPYTLDEFFPDNNAVKTKQNHVDPQEQVETRLRPGNYILHIVGSKIPDIQNFTMVSNIPLSDVEKNIKVEPMNEHIHKIYESIEK